MPVVCCVALICCPGLLTHFCMVSFPCHLYIRHVICKIFLYGEDSGKHMSRIFWAPHIDCRLYSFNYV